MLARMAAGSISAQATPCGTRQSVPKAAATPCAMPSPELANAMPDSSAACDMASRAGRESPCSTASTIAGTANFKPVHRQGAGNRLRLPRYVTLDQLRDRVHAAGRRDLRRNRHRQLGIDQGNPRHQPIVAEALLERRIVARRSPRFSWPRRPCPPWTAWPAPAAAAGRSSARGRRSPDSPDRRTLAVGGHRGRGLGQVDGRAAADGQQEIALGRAAGRESGRPCDPRRPLPARAGGWPAGPVRPLRPGARRQFRPSRPAATSGGSPQTRNARRPSVRPSTPTSRRRPQPKTIRGGARKS